MTICIPHQRLYGQEQRFFFLGRYILYCRCANSTQGKLKKFDRGIKEATSLPNRDRCELFCNTEPTPQTETFRGKIGENTKFISDFLCPLGTACLPPESQHERRGHSIPYVVQRRRGIGILVFGAKHLHKRPKQCPEAATQTRS